MSGLPAQPQPGQVRVLLYHQAPDAAPIAAAYHEVSRRLAPVPGLLGNELLRSLSDPTGFVVVSSWRDLAAFQDWEQGPDHKESTSPLRPYRSRPAAQAAGLYTVTAAY